MDDRKDATPKDLDQTVDLAAKLKLDDRARGFMGAVMALSRVAQPLTLVMMGMSKAEQRFLLQIAAWRMEGAPYLPATNGLAHMPLLTGMGFDQIETVAQGLVESGVVEIIPIKEDEDGEPTSMAFRWPAFERLLLQGMEMAKGPQLVRADGRALR